MSTTKQIYKVLTNGTTLVVHGEIVCASANKTFVRASTVALFGFLGVNGSGTVGPGGVANIFTSGASVDVLLDTGLTPVAGQTVYVSTNAGRGTTAAPSMSVIVGTIVDASAYALTWLVTVSLSIGASSAGASSGTIFVPNVATLTALPSASYSAGTSVYVATLQRQFTLNASTQPVATNCRIPAAGKSGYQWLSDDTSSAWWSQVIWYWDPANLSGLANDENDGATAITPLRTNDEWRRRTFGRHMPVVNAQTMIVNLISDCADTDVFCADLAPDSQFSSYIEVQGLVTPISVGTITAAQALNQGANQGNQITVPGFDFSGHIGRNLRLVGTTGLTSTCAVIEQAISLGVCRLGEMFVSGPDTTPPGFTVGQIVEIMSLPKLSGLEVRGSTTAIIDCKIDNGSAGGITLSVDTLRGGLTMWHCELRGTGGGTIYAAPTISLNAGSIVGAGWLTYNGTFNTIGGSMVNATLTLGVAGGLRHHIADFGGTNSQIYCYDSASLRLHGSYHMFNLAANGVGVFLRYGAIMYTAAAYYGSGNNANSAGICMLGSARYIAQGGIPTVDAGLAIYFDSNDGRSLTDPANTGFSIAWSALAARTGQLTPRLGAYVNG